MRVSLKASGLALAMAVAGAVPAQADVIFGLQGSDRIVTFDSATPGTIAFNRAITGLGAGEVLTGIDVRPATDGLYALATSGNLYQLTAGGGVYAATLIGSLTTNTVGGTPVPITGANFGIDFNPVPDRLRFVTDSDQNLRINPNNAVTTTDGTINPSTFNLIGAAYANNLAGARSTTLYGIDSLTTSLVRSTNPNAGSYVSVGSLGLGPIGSDARVGFDISGVSGTAFLGLNDTLYTVDLNTGAATAIGAIGASNIRGLTSRGAIPEPATWAMMIMGFAGLGAAMRRRRAFVRA